MFCPGYKDLIKHIYYFSVPLQIPSVVSGFDEWHITGKITNNTVLFRFMAIKMHYKEII
jgi:hypothetical protein